jgi:hypothetical protein
MKGTHETRNDALVRYLLLPTLFLVVALLGGLRVSEPEHTFLFVAPPLITLILAVMLMAQFVRGHLIQVDQWLRADRSPLTNTSHALTLLTLFFASAQAFNSVLPDGGLLSWLFSFFFLWTMWNNLFSPFNARQLVRSLAAMFGMAFVLKHILAASLAAPEGSWLQKLSAVILEGLSLGTLKLPAYAPATGYISFFTLALFVVGLYLLPSAPVDYATKLELVPTVRRDPALALNQMEAAPAALEPAEIVEYVDEEVTVVTPIKPVNVIDDAGR